MDCRAKFIVAPTGPAKAKKRKKRPAVMQKLKRWFGQAFLRDGPVATSEPARERQITMYAVWSADDPENKPFSRDELPSGTITFLLKNPELADLFRPLETYYVDFTRAVDVEFAKAVAGMHLGLDYSAEGKKFCAASLTAQERYCVLVYEIAGWLLTSGANEFSIKALLRWASGKILDKRGCKGSDQGREPSGAHPA